MRQDLRHFDNRLSNHRQLRSKELDDVGQLFRHLRHRDLEPKDQLVPNPRVPLHLPLRPRLQQGRRPRPPLGVLLIKQPEERRGRRGLLSPWRLVLVPVPLLPGPGRLLSP